MKKFYDPNPEQLLKLEKGNWICSYSGGKDSTSLVTWMEYLRRKGWITCEKPRLVMSDTTVEYPFLAETCRDMLSLLKASGWECTVVKPPVGKRLYTSIFGRGNTPVHQALRKMRWCTKGTKIVPMDKFRETLPSDLLSLTGLRWGESSVRDGKITAAGCVAGGECGVPGVGEGSYAPIINWTGCQVYDWLSGQVARDVQSLMKDTLPVTNELLRLYGAKVSKITPLVGDPEVFMGRFGCTGCPAVPGTTAVESVRAARPDMVRGLWELYGLMDEMREDRNRLPPKAKNKHPGPLKMEARKRLYEKFLLIEKKLGFKLVSEEDDAFIRKCWEDGVYPRGWSKEDEIRRFNLL